MKSLPTVPPDHCMTTFAFHYCHLFLSHMGYLSWNKRWFEYLMENMNYKVHFLFCFLRNSLDLLNKSDQLIRELKHLDDTQTQWLVVTCQAPILLLLFVVTIACCYYCLLLLLFVVIIECSRQTYKVAVLYISCGQEDRQSILRNSKASRPFEEFVSGLGWEVRIDTHCHGMDTQGMTRSAFNNNIIYHIHLFNDNIIYLVSLVKVT